MDALTVVCIITHADESRGSKAFSGVCVCDVRVCLFIRMIKPKTAETTITKLAAGIVHHESSPVN